MPDVNKVGYENLANAIIAVAAEDYWRAWATVRILGNREDEYAAAYAKWRQEVARQAPFVVPITEGAAKAQVLDNARKILSDCERYFQGEEISWHCQGLSPEAIWRNVKSLRMAKFAAMRKKILTSIKTTVNNSAANAKRKNEQLRAKQEEKGVKQ